MQVAVKYQPGPAAAAARWACAGTRRGWVCCCHLAGCAPHVFLAGWPRVGVLTHCRWACCAWLTCCRAGAVRRFFEDYKKNEHKDVKVDDILGAADAMKCVKDSLNMYQVRRTACIIVIYVISMSTAAAAAVQLWDRAVVGRDNTHAALCLVVCDVVRKAAAWTVCD